VNLSSRCDLASISCIHIYVYFLVPWCVNVQQPVSFFACTKQRIPKNEFQGMLCSALWFCESGARVSSRCLDLLWCVMYCACSAPQQEDDTLHSVDTATHCLGPLHCSLTQLRCFSQLFVSLIMVPPGSLSVAACCWQAADIPACIWSGLTYLCNPT
jgi:hypothetical protein